MNPISPSRRQFLFTAPLILTAQQPRKPNIILILADDLGWGDLSCYGQKHFRTPNLDQMAAGGMRFTDAYAGCTVCAPSRSVLMTGMHTGHTSVRSNAGGVPLLESDVTVAEVLREAGYTNGLFGKWGLGDIGTPTTAVKKGFDVHVGFLHQAHAHFQYPRFIYYNDKEYPLEGNSDTTRKTYANDVFVRHALEFIRQNRSRPFFTFLSLTIPHYEPHVPEDSMQEFRGKFPKVLWSQKDGRLAPQPDLLAAFAGMVTRIDRYAGQVLSLLAELGLERDTLVLFASDNGGLRAGDNYFSSTGPFRGMKGDLYEGGIRVPMIARWPGRIPAGRVSEFPWAFEDFLPTAAELAGTRNFPKCDGMSILPTLSGETQKPHPQLYWEHSRYDRKTGLFADEIPMQAIRRGNWKAVRPKPNGILELYDLRSDPGEQTNLAPKHPDLVADLERAMRASRVPPRPQKEPDHPWWEARS